MAIISRRSRGKVKVKKIFMRQGLTEWLLYIVEAEGLVV
jgi:hypothetical protein